MPLVSGTRIGHYEVAGLLGSGGMGEVYRARDLTLDRNVALKFLPVHLTNDADRLRRFEQEARAASALNHPAIVSIYELGRTDDQPYISMELVEGQTMRQLAARGAVPPRRLLNHASQIASALAKAHAAGIVHRDLKPDNLMISSDDHAKILDFGLAKLAPDPIAEMSQATTVDHGTKAGVLLGTIGYMSPEQATGGTVDFRSDQFSFGLVLYELLTGRRPFDRATTVETLSAIIRDDLPPLEVSNAGLAPLAWIVERCLAKAPEDRYASTHDLAVDLARVRDRFGDRSAVSTSTPTPVRRATGRRERMAWVAAAAFAVLAGTLLLIKSGGAPTGAGAPMRFNVAPPAGGDFSHSVGVSPFAAAPGGRHVAFIATAEGLRVRQAWLRSFDSLQPRAIAGTENASYVFWSPDGKTLGFMVGGKLKKVAIDGGTVDTICDMPGGGGGGASWSRDNVILFAPGIENSDLYRVPAGGGTPVQETKLSPPTELSYLRPVFLPDGRHYVFFLFGKESGTYLGALDSPERTRLTNAFVMAAVQPDWLYLLTQDRKLMAQRFDLGTKALVGSPVVVVENVALSGPTPAVDVSVDGTIMYWDGTGSRNFTQLTWVARDGKALGTVGPIGPYMNVRLSPDGRQAAVDQPDGGQSILLIDVERGSTSRASFGKIYDSTPIWSPDSRAFVFASARETPPNLYVASVDNTQADPRRLTTSEIQQFPQAWSADGVIVFIRIETATATDIWSVPAAGKESPRPLIRTEFNERHPRVSPDRRWLAYTSNEGGREDVYVTRYPSAMGKWSVSIGGGGWPMWKPDSRELYYRRPDGKLMAVPTAASTVSEFVAGKPQELFTLTGRPALLGGGTFYDVAADGRFLVNAFVERRTQPAAVILNWMPK